MKGIAALLACVASAALAQSGATAQPSLTIAWRVPIGPAMSAVTISEGLAYTLENDGDDDYLVALEAASGKPAWRAKIGRTHADALNNGPGSTPAVTSGLVVVMGSSCTLSAFSARDGKPAWSVDFAQAYKTRFAARNSCFISPLVHRDLVVMPTGSMQTDRVVALDAATGKQRWSAPGVEGSLNTNTSLWTAKAGPQLLYHYFKAPGTSGIAAINLSDGSTAWAMDAESGLSNTAPMPLGNGRVLLQTWGGSFVLEAADTGAPRRVWSSSALVALPVPAVAVGGHIYGFGGNSGEHLTCVDAATGVTKWTERTYRGAISVAGDTLVMQAEGSGLLRLIAADPTKYRELARLQVLKPGATTLARPAISNGRIYVRNLEEVVAVAVSRVP